MNQLQKSRIIDCFYELTETRDGFTLTQAGIEVTSSSGYAVAVYDASSIADALDYLDALVPEIASELFLGFWTDPLTKVSSVGVSRIILDRGVAITVARLFNQRAIWSFATATIVVVDEDQATAA